MTTKTPTATGRTTADEPTTQARPQGTHIGRVVNSASGNPCSSARQGMPWQFIDLPPGLDRQRAQRQERIRPPDSRGSRSACIAYRRAGSSGPWACSDSAPVITTSRVGPQVGRQITRWHHLVCHGNVW
jgi:hypothetical protein